jgi:hypothetical protein
MGVRLYQNMRCLLAVTLLLSGGQLLIGCSKDAEISKTEAEQIKQGPPKEMPAAAKAMFEKASKSGPPPQAGPPKGGQ